MINNIFTTTAAIIREWFRVSRSLNQLSRSSSADDDLQLSRLSSKSASAFTQRGSWAKVVKKGESKSKTGKTSFSLLHLLIRLLMGSTTRLTGSVSKDIPRKAASFDKFLRCHWFVNVCKRGKRRVTEKSQHGKQKEIQKLKETKGGKKAHQTASWCGGFFGVVLLVFVALL